MKAVNSIVICVAVTLASLTALPSEAAIIFAGSWQVDQGPSWTTNPPVYSGQEAAALLFGGSPSDYVISTIDNNPLNVDHMAWYSVFGVDGGTRLSETFRLDDAPAGYRFPELPSAAASAYVRDSAVGNTYTNYAFREGEVAAVPEPASLTLWSLGALGLAFAGYRRRKSA